MEMEVFFPGGKKVNSTYKGSLWRYRVSKPENKNQNNTRKYSRVSVSKIHPCGKA